MTLLSHSIDRGVLAVRQGKGKKDRFVPISERAVHWLQRYLEEVRTGFAIEPDPHSLFLDKTGLPLIPDLVPEAGRGRRARGHGRGVVGNTGI